MLIIMTASNIICMKQFEFNVLSRGHITLHAYQSLVECIEKQIKRKLDNIAMSFPVFSLWEDLLI